MRENAICMVFHSSPNPTLVTARLGRDSETRGEKNPSHMENHKECISYIYVTPIRIANEIYPLICYIYAFVYSDTQNKRFSQ